MLTTWDEELIATLDDNIDLAVKVVVNPVFVYSTIEVETDES